MSHNMKFGTCCSAPDAIFHGALAGAVAALCLSIGCNRTSLPELVPVTGRVVIDGKPAAEGAVVYRQQSSGAIEASGIIQSDGTYSLLQKERQGAQPGKYSVVVVVRRTPKNAAGEMTGLPEIVVNPKFTNPKTTPLSVEVKKDAPPGQYDLAVTK
jgi:hypothetical protein